MRPSHQLYTTLIALMLIVGSAGVISARSGLQDGDQQLAVGVTALVGPVGATLVSVPSADAEVLDELPPGTSVWILGDVQENDDTRWWPVQVVETGIIGFVGEDYLVAAAPADILRPPPGVDDILAGTPEVTDDLRALDTSELQVLPLYDGRPVLPVAISPAGQMLGRVDAYDDRPVMGVIWQGDTWEAITWAHDAVQGAGFDPFDINDRGQVAAALTLPDGGTQAVRWEAGELLALTPPLGNPDGGLRPSAINNHGDIVGWGTIVAEGTPSAGTTGFRWTEDEGLRALPTDTLDAMAFDINDAGDIVGHISGEPVLWGNGPFVRLPIPDDVDYIYVAAVNAAGHVVGYSSSGRPLLWMAGQLFELPMPEGCTTASVSAINNTGQIVGNISCRGSNLYAAMWRVATDGIQVRTVPHPESWLLQSILDVTDDGMVLVLAVPADYSSRAGAALWHVPDGEHVDVVPAGTPMPAATPMSGTPVASPQAVPDSLPPPAASPPASPERDALRRLS